MSKTYFISGHLDLTEKEFNKFYKERIQNAMSNDAKFVVGDAKGADSLAQQFLAKYDLTGCLKDYKVTVYHMFEKPRNNPNNFKTIGGFQSDEERDKQMTLNSDEDILWQRPVEEQKKKLGKKYNPLFINGTLKNMLRREELKLA